MEESLKSEHLEHKEREEPDSSANFQEVVMMTDVVWKCIRDV
jgi:hypothetical protein